MQKVSAIASLIAASSCLKKLVKIKLRGYSEMLLNSNLKQHISGSYNRKKKIKKNYKEHNMIQQRLRVTRFTV